MKKYVLLLSLIGLVACQGDSQNEEASNLDQDWTHTYTYQNGWVEQQLNVKFLNDRLLLLNLRFEDETSSCVLETEGVARKEMDQANGELEENTKGLTVPVETFVLETGSAKIRIRIEEKERAFARVLNILELQEPMDCELFNEGLMPLRDRP